jgi:HEAT repeat protein
MSLERLLNELSNLESPLSMRRLAYLSSLSRQEGEALAQTWKELPLPRRRQVVSKLVDLAEDNPGLNFDTVFRICLDDQDEEVRVKAIEGLWECEERWLIDALLQLLASDPSPKVRAGASSALGRFILLAELGKLRPTDGERIEKALLATIAQPEEPTQVRRRAVEAIAPRSLEQVTSIIEEAYRSPEREMRASALYAMGRNCDARWLPTLVQELDSADNEMRFEAANACGEMEDPRAVPHLIPLIEDFDLQVQLAAIWALGKIGGERARQALRSHRRDPDERIRHATQEALAELEANEDPLRLDIEV